MSCPVCGEPVEADPATGDATVTAEGTAHEECATHDGVTVLPDGGLLGSPSSAVSVRVEVTEREVTWHTSETAYERLHNHPSGNLVAEIETDAKSRDGTLFDVIAAMSGAYWMLEVDA